MRAFITGVSGFVGRHLRQHLQAEGDDVLGSTRKLGPNADSSALVEWDVGAPLPDAARLQLEKFAPDVIFHLASISIPRECGETEPTPIARRVNIDGVMHAISAAMTMPSRPRVVFTSSSHVYGSMPIDAPPVAESSPIAPRTAYGKTKADAEEICRRVVEQGRSSHVAETPEIVIVRSFTMSGPGQDGRLMLAEWADQFVAPKQETVQVVSLESTIDFLDVRDGVRALRAIALRGAAGGVYNLGSGVPRTSGEIFRIMQEQTGDRRPVIELRPGRRSDPIADVSQLRDATGWSAQIAPSRTVADVLEDRRNRS